MHTLRLLLAATAFIGNAASAADLTVTGLLSQGFSAGTSEDGANTSLRSSTDIGVGIERRSGIFDFSLTPGATLIARSESDNDDDVQVTPRFTGNFTYRAPRLRLTGQASAITSFRDTRDFDTLFVTDPDTGALETVAVARDANPLQFTLSGNLGSEIFLTPRSSAVGSVFVRYVDFDETTASLQPSRTLGASTGLRLGLTPRTTGTVDLRFRDFTSDRAGGNEGTNWSLTSGARVLMTPRHIVNFSGGLSVTDTDETTLGFTGNAGLQYSLGRTAYTLGAVSAVDQNDDGEVVNTVRLSGLVSHAINQRHRVSLGSSLSSEAPIDDGTIGDELTFRLSPRYEVALTPLWSATASYGLVIDRTRGAAQELEVDHQVLLRLSHRFTILP